MGKKRAKVSKDPDRGWWWYAAIIPLCVILVFQIGYWLSPLPAIPITDIQYVSLDGPFQVNDKLSHGKRFVLLVFCLGLYLYTCIATNQRSQNLTLRSSCCVFIEIILFYQPADVVTINTGVPGFDYVAYQIKHGVTCGSPPLRCFFGDVSARR